MTADVFSNATEGMTATCYQMSFQYEDVFSLSLSLSYSVNRRSWNIG